MGKYPKTDLAGFAQACGFQLQPQLDVLREIYADVDARNSKNIANLDLPCQRGCDACCHESVFLTTLEFLGAWDWIQTNLPSEAMDEIIDKGLALYQENQEIIDAFDSPPPEGQKDHFSLARQLKFRCPILGEDGACRVYPMRELLGRLFGCSFNSTGGIYGCHLVGEHLAGKVVTLLPAKGTANRLEGLPLTNTRQVYPHYIHWLYG